MSASKLPVISRLLADDDPRILRGILIAVGALVMMAGFLINYFMPESYCPAFIWAGASGLCLLIAFLSLLSPSVNRNIFDYSSFCYLFVYLAVIYLAYQNNLETTFTHILIVSHIFFAISFRNFGEYAVFAVSSLLLFNILTFYALDPQTNPYLFVIIIALATLFAGIHVLFRERVYKRKTEAAHLLRDLLNTSVYGIFLLDETCERVLFQNELAGQYLKKVQDKESLNGTQLLYMLGLDKKFLQNRVANSPPGFQDKSYYTLRTEAGESIQIQIYFARIRTPESDNMLIKIQDITERKQQEQKLRESEQQYRILVEKMNDGMMLTDMNETILFVNSRLAKMLQMPREKMIGQKSYEVIPEANNREKIISHSKLRAHRIADQYELQVQRRNGGSLWLLINGAPYIDASDEVVGTIAIITDITGRKQAELKLKDKNLELDSFTYKASHDLKGPLASIMGLSNIARDEVSDPKAIRYFDLIDQSTRRLDTILTDLIDLTRLNKAISEIQPIDIEKLIWDIVESLKHRKEAENINISVKVGKHAEFQTDVNLLTSILQNLIVNSINYHDPNQRAPKIDISVRQKASNLVFTITDNGVGIPDEMKDRVFEMFYRANTKSKGSGLGLYIVKNSIDKLHGEYKLESKEGKGTRFTFSIPFSTLSNGSSQESKANQKKEVSL